MTDAAADTGIWSQLVAVIEHRDTERPPGSYVVQLLEGGHSEVASKVIEEAYELIEAAAAHPDGEHSIAHETADLLFHVLVLLRVHGVEWVDVERELRHRFGTSGPQRHS